MIHNCERCGKDFLTEADDSIQKYFKGGVRKLFCWCELEEKDAQIKALKDDLKFLYGFTYPPEIAQVAMRFEEIKKKHKLGE